MIMFSPFPGKSGGQITKWSRSKATPVMMSLQLADCPSSLLFPKILNVGAAADRRLCIYTLLSTSSEMDGNWD